MNRKYSVVSVSDNGQLNLDHVTADNAMAAFYKAAKLRKNEGDVEFICALNGHIDDDMEEIYFPGLYSVVGSQDILSKEGREVFQ